MKEPKEFKEHLGFDDKMKSSEEARAAAVNALQRQAKEIEGMFSEDEGKRGVEGVGPGRYCPPRQRHRVPFNSTNEGAKCVG